VIGGNPGISMIWGASASEVADGDGLGFAGGAGLEFADGDGFADATGSVSVMG
jgi:hypothetical protein